MGILPMPHGLGGSVEAVATLSVGEEDGGQSPPYEQLSSGDSRVGFAHLFARYWA